MGRKRSIDPLELGFELPEIAAVPGQKAMQPRRSQQAEHIVGQIGPQTHQRVVGAFVDERLNGVFEGLPLGGRQLGLIAADADQRRFFQQSAAPPGRDGSLRGDGGLEDSLVLGQIAGDLSRRQIKLVRALGRASELQMFPRHDARPQRRWHWAGSECLPAGQPASAKRESCQCSM